MSPGPANAPPRTPTPPPPPSRQQLLSGRPVGSDPLLYDIILINLLMMTCCVVCVLTSAEAETERAGLQDLGLGDMAERHDTI